MKEKLIFVLIFFIALTVFCAVRDSVIKEIVRTAASDVVGAPVHIGGLSLSIMRQSIKITNFKISSPKDFPPEVMIDIPLTYVSCDVFSFFKKTVHLKALTFDLKEAVLVENKNGKSNINSLKIFEKKGPMKLVPLRMDVVQLSVGRVVEKNYSVSGAPEIKVYEVNFKTRYKNVGSIQQLAALIIAEPLKAAGLHKLSEYGVSMLTGVAAFPVSVAFTFAAKDFCRAGYNVFWSKAFDVSLKVLKESGMIKDENKEAGIINAEVRGSLISLKLRKLSWRKTQITISARKFLLPHPEVAAGIMYCISEKLK